jgi:hypothetical protein
MGPAFTKLRVFSTKPSLLATHFFPSAWDTICWSPRNLYWSIRSLRVCCVSARCHHPQNDVVGVHLQEARKEEVGGCWIRTVERMRDSSPPHCCNNGVWSGNAMPAEDVIHLPVSFNPGNLLF